MLRPHVTFISDLTTAVIEKAKLEGAEADRITKGLKWLGLFSDEAAPKAGNIMDTLCATLGAKMQYKEGERDMTMLQHVFEVELPSGIKVLQNVHERCSFAKLTMLPNL